MKKLLAIVVLSFSLTGCFGALGYKHGWNGCCSDRTLLGECSKPCAKHHEKPTPCECSKTCSCWESHPGTGTAVETTTLPKD